MPKHVITVCLISLLGIPAFAQEQNGIPKQKITPEALENDRRAIEKACQSDEFSGAVLVASKHEPPWTEACGLADREKNTPMKVDTPLRIASMGKMFTSIAILQLMEKGKIDLSAPLLKYIPDYPNKEAAQKLTIGHLLSHTGGTGDIFGPEGFAHRAELREPADYVRVFGSQPLRFEPGSKVEYSNFGFILLGVVVQNISGQTYYDYIREHIFEVMGMKATTFPIEDSEPSTLSTGYTHMVMGPQGPSHEKSLSKVTMAPYRGASAGGGFSTVTDLTLFAHGILDGKLIAPETLKRVLAADLLISGKNYSYGFWKKTDAKGRTWIGHGGGSPGTNGELRIYPSERLIVTALSNLDPPSAEKVVENISSQL